MTTLTIDHPHPGATFGVDDSAASPLAFELDVRPHLQALQRRALRLTRDTGAADDLVQDTLERGYRKRTLFQPGTDLRAWLLTIMRNIWINTHRRRTAEPNTVSLDELDEFALHHHLPAGASSTPDVAWFVADHLGEAAILTMIHALPPSFRDVVVLADIEGVPYKLIAETLRIPVGSVCSRLSRARRRLRRALHQQDDGVGCLARAS